jgi:hypothetical protein
LKFLDVAIPSCAFALEEIAQVVSERGHGLSVRLQYWHGPTIGQFSLHPTNGMPPFPPMCGRVPSGDSTKDRVIEAEALKSMHRWATPP